MNEKIKWFIIGFLVGIFTFWVCSRCNFGGFDVGTEYRKAVDDNKRKSEEYYQAASELNSRAANYNKQLEAGAADADKLLRELDRIIEQTIKNRTQENKRRENKG